MNYKNNYTQALNSCQPTLLCKVMGLNSSSIAFPKIFLLLMVTIFFNSNVKALPFGVPFVRTCYQEYTQKYKNPQTVKLLKSGPSVEVTLGTTHITDITAFYIYKMEGSTPIPYTYISYPSSSSNQYVIGVVNLDTDNKYKIVSAGSNNMSSYDRIY